MAAYCKGTCNIRTNQRKNNVCVVPKQDYSQICASPCWTEESRGSCLSGPKNRGSIPGRSKRFLYLPKRRDRLRRSAQPRTSWIRGLFLQGPSSRETKLTTRICLLPSWCKQDRTGNCISNLSFPCGLYCGRQRYFETKRVRFAHTDFNTLPNMSLKCN